MKTPLEQFIEWADDFVESRKASPNIHQITKKATELMEAEKQHSESAWDASRLSFAQEIGNDMSEEKSSGITIYKSHTEYYLNEFKR